MVRISSYFLLLLKLLYEKYLSISTKFILFIIFFLIVVQTSQNLNPGWYKEHNTPFCPNHYDPSNPVISEQNESSSDEAAIVPYYHQMNGGMNCGGCLCGKVYLETKEVMVEKEIECPVKVTVKARYTRIRQKRRTVYDEIEVKVCAPALVKCTQTRQKLVCRTVQRSKECEKCRMYYDYEEKVSISPPRYIRSFVHAHYSLIVDYLFVCLFFSTYQHIRLLMGANDVKNVVIAIVVPL